MSQNPVDFVMELLFGAFQNILFLLQLLKNNQNIFLSNVLESIGKLPPEFDLQIASIAIANNMILVTRNTKDFAQISSVSNLMLENWWEE